MAIEPGAGAVAITLEGRDVQLVPSLEACLEIASRPEGIEGTVARLMSLHFPTYCEVIGAGLVIDGNRLSNTLRQRELPKTIFEAGMIQLQAACVTFCHIVANGGRPLEVDEDEDEAGDRDENPLSSRQPSSSEASSDAQPAG